MTSLESIEKLRNRVNPMMPLNAEIIASEIEREIAEKYMELPVDVDCVPIHVGDTLLKSTGAPKASYGEVVGVSDDSVFFKVRQGWESNWASLTRHVKPRTVEDVLNDFAKRVLNSGHQWGLDAEETTAEYADEIRELMGVGE